MKKPEKKEKWTLCPTFPDTKKADMDIASYYLIEGYNIALKDYEAFLPSEEEIVRIIGGFSYPSVMGLPAIDALKFLDLAKAISKRLGGEK